MRPKIPPAQLSPYGGSSQSSAEMASLPRAGRHHRDHRQAREAADDDGSAPPPWTLAPQADRFLNSRQVRERYAGASDMWLWRRLNDDSDFPKPIEIAGRRYWKLSALVAWERARARGAD